MKNTLLSFGLLLTLSMSSGLWAQQSGYSQTNLVSNVAGVASTTDSQLLNPWGISVLPGQDFWVADNNSGVSTLYELQLSVRIILPAAPFTKAWPCSEPIFSQPTSTAAK